MLLFSRSSEKQKAQVAWNSVHFQYENSFNRERIDAISAQDGTLIRTNWPLFFFPTLFGCVCVFFFHFGT